jgi:hypothetical protein
MEIAIYSDALRADYHNDCGAYYAAQIAPGPNKPAAIGARSRRSRRKINDLQH